MINKDKLKRRFSRQAKTYDKYARVQKQMGDHLMTFTKDKQPHHILEIGSGTGYVTRQLVQAFPKATITAVDLAPGMVKLAQKNMPHPGLDFICGDIETMDFDKTFDLIISNATFQWFNQPRQTLEKLHRLLTKDGSLCFSTFGKETFYELHETYQTLSQDHRPGQAFMTMAQVNNLLQDIFTDHVPHSYEDQYVELFDSCLCFFESIKKIGANNASSKSSVKDPQFLNRVMAHYESHYRIENKVKATYHALFIKASK